MEASATGAKARGAKCRRMISWANRMPAIGALNTVEIAEATPQAIATLTVVTSLRKNRASVLPRLPPM